MPKSGLHVNGVVYWMTTSGSILAFDLTKERSQLLQNYDSRGILGEYSGKLCKMNVCGNSISLSILDNVHTNTMQMGSQTKMWAVKPKVVLDSKIVGNAAGDYTALHVDSNMLVVRSLGKAFLYDFKSRATKCIPGEFHNSRCLPYVNSLVSL